MRARLGTPKQEPGTRVCADGEAASRSPVNPINELAIVPSISSRESVFTLYCRTSSGEPRTRAIVRVTGARDTVSAVTRAHSLR